MTLTRLTIAAVTLAIALLAVTVRAADKWPAWTDAERLVFVKAIAAENSGDEDDSAAMGHLFVRTWRRVGRLGVDSIIRNYCALWNEYSRYYRRPESVAIRNATLTEAPQGPDAASWVKKWPRIVAFVDRFAAGKVRDTCPGAMHFGNNSDAPRMRGRKVLCRYKNIFWE